MDVHVLAYDYPLLGLFWSIVLIFLFVLWLFLLFRVFADIFRSDDLSGWAKVLWMVLVIVLPFLGVVIYLTVRGTEMGQREWATAKASERRVADYISQTASTEGGTADELAKLADLRDHGVISADEFEAQKASILG